MMEFLTKLFDIAITASFPELPNPPQAIIAVGLKFSDYQCNSAMKLADALKSIFIAQGAKPLSPRDVALKIIQNLPETPVVEKYDVAGPGFINIHIATSYIENVINSILLNGVKPPKCDPKNVVIDFSSPNIGKCSSI